MDPPFWNLLLKSCEANPCGARLPCCHFAILEKADGTRKQNLRDGGKFRLIFAKLAYCNPERFCTDASVAQNEQRAEQAMDRGTRKHNALFKKPKAMQDAKNRCSSMACPSQNPERQNQHWCCDSLAAAIPMNFFMGTCTLMDPCGAEADATTTAEDGLA